MIKLVIFDFDDTLLDDTASTQAGLRALIERHGLHHVSFTELHARHQQIIDDLSPRLFAGEIDGNQARLLRFGQLLTEYGVQEADGNVANELYRAAYKAAWQLCDGGREVLTHLKGEDYRLALLSNYVREVQMEKVERFGLASEFDGLFFMEDVPAPKPDSRAFLTVCERLGVTPEQAVMVGDSLKNDVEGALGAGLKAVWYNRWQTAGPAVPTIRHLSELPALLRTLA